MSKYLLRSAMVVSLAAVVFALALPARAEDQAQEKAVRHKRLHYAGTIESINAAAGTVTVKNSDGETKTFTCDTTSKFTTSTSSQAALSDLKIGDNASVRYTESDGKLVCQELVARKPAPPAPKQEEVKAKEVVAPRIINDHQFSGKITSIDAATRTVTISKDAHGFSTVTVTCAADCEFETNGGLNKHLALSDMKVGVGVAARCTEENGKFVCHLLVGQQILTH